MSTITREQQKQILIDTANHVINRDNTSPHSENMRELARMASLEAEAVAFRSKLKPPYAGSERWDYTDHRQPDAFELENCFIERLFTAPPAPVSVPEWTNEQCLEFLSIAFRHAEIKGDIQLDDIRLGVKMVNGSRAAMLQGADRNSPVIPDGWVACSERMPDENAEKEVLACFKGGDISTLYYFEGRWDDAYGIVPIRQDVTHWMPLPAAPQQEVK